jgi:hypothetical protein
MGVMEASLSAKSQQRKRQRTEAMDRVRDWLQVAETGTPRSSSELLQPSQPSQSQEQMTEAGLQPLSTEPQARQG